MISAKENQRQEYIGDVSIVIGYIYVKNVGRKVMKFKKYSEIENSYRKKYMDILAEYGLTGGDDWLVLEKIHGSNFSISCDGTEVKVAKRSAFLSDSSNFFNWESIYDKYAEKIKEAQKLICRQYNIEVFSQVIFYGELFGGIYPHADVQPVPNATKVQKGVYYCPHNDWFIFDAYIMNDDIGNQWMNYCKLRDICSVTHLPYVKVLKSGTLNECLEYPNDFESTIYKYFNLPKIEDNICEGVVIKPNIPRYMPNGERVIIKNKNEKWSEKSKESRQPRQAKEPVELSDNVKEHINSLSALINENRLHNVLSKFGQVTNKDFGKLMSSMVSDIMSEYLKDNKDNYDALEKVNQKLISKRITRVVADLVRSNFVNIIDGTF